MKQLKRDIYKYLQTWQDEPRRKPILLRGARQVGKSWLARKLGEGFRNFVEINFEKTPDLCTFFEGNIDPHEIVKNISNYLGVKITAGETLLFLDEIQGCPRAILALRYFYEDFPSLHVIAAGSLLEFQLKNISVPVGRVTFLYVYPLSFGEYLTSLGKEGLRDSIRENKKQPLPEPIHRQLLQDARDYTILGGMPEVVADFIERGDFHRSRDIQTGLLETYRSDFNKYAQKHQLKYLNKVFDSVPLQLGNKFKYSHISRDIKSRELGDALELLEMAGIIYKVYHSSANGIPLKAESDLKRFKVLFFDIGLALRLLKLDFRPLLLDPDISMVNNGAVAELLAGLEFIAYQDFRARAELFYWHKESKSSNAEVDYVTTIGSRIVPVEVKSGTRGRQKSLDIFMKAKNIDFAVKVSALNFSQLRGVESVPLYAMETLFNHNP